MPLSRKILYAFLIIALFFIVCGDEEDKWTTDLILISHHPIDAISPYGLTSDGDSFYVVDRAYPGEILKISMLDATTINRYESPSIQPSGISFHNNYIWTTDEHSDLIYKHNKSSMEVIESYPTPSDNPSAICFNPDGHILVCDWIEGVIYELDNEFQVIREFKGPRYESHFTGIECHNEYIWTSEGMVGYIYKHSSNGEIMKTYLAPWKHPSGIYLSDDEFLWVVDSSIRSLIKCQKP